MLNKIKKWIEEHKAEVCLGGMITVSYLLLNKKIDKCHKSNQEIAYKSLENIGYTSGLLSHTTEDIRDIKYLQKKMIETKGSK